MSLLPTGVRRRLRNRAPEWDRPVHADDRRPDTPAEEPGPTDRERLIDGFHRLYYESGDFQVGTPRNLVSFQVPPASPDS